MTHMDQSPSTASDGSNTVTRLMKSHPLAISVAALVVVVAIVLLIISTTSGKQNTATDLGAPSSGKFPIHYPLTLGDTFSVEMRFSLGQQQPPYATILTTHNVAQKGFSIENNSAGQTALFFGTGNALVASAPFTLAPGVDHQLSLSAVQGKVTLVVDGVTAYNNPAVILAPSDGELIAGGWYPPSRNVDGNLISITVTGGVPKK